MPAHQLLQLLEQQAVQCEPAWPSADIPGSPIYRTTSSAMRTGMACSSGRWHRISMSRSLLK